MVTDVSKNKAKRNGAVVRLKPASLKSYSGGEFYIRAYVGYTGHCGVEVMRVVGQRYKTKESRKYHKGDTCFKIMTLTEYSWYRTGHNHEYYCGDLGLQKEYGNKLYHFTNESYELIKELVNKNDKVNLLKLLHGYSVEEAEERVIDMKWQEEMDREMERDYYGDDY